MSYELVEMVLDHAPEMTPAEALILVAVAEETRWLGEVRKISHARLSKRTKLNRGLRDALARLAARGIEVRVPLGVDKRGRPQYTVDGEVPRYRLPRFPAPEGCECERCKEQVTPQRADSKPQVKAGDAVARRKAGDAVASRMDATASPRGDATASKVDATASPKPCHGDLRSPMAMPDDAAAGGASPSGETPAAEEESESLPAADAIKLARANLGVVGKGKPASRWKPFRASAEGPNPRHDPAALAEARRQLEALEAVEHASGGDAA